MKRSLAPSQRKQGSRDILPQSRVIANKSNSNGESTLPRISEESHNQDPVVPIKYRVIFGKIGTKTKQKTFANDGFLEIKENRMILVDSDDVVKCSQTNPTAKPLTVGQHLIIGDQECQIVAAESNETTDDSVAVFQAVSDFKVPTLRETKHESCQESTQLTMPDPPPSHQKHFNKCLKPITEVKCPPELTEHLRPHQREGIIFLYECLMGFKDDLPDKGAILCDEMGLGKTLQCLSLCHILLKQGPYGGDAILRKILIVTPCSLIKNWENEVEKWLSKVGPRLFSYTVDADHKPHQYSGSSNTPFLIISYEMLLRHIDYMLGVRFDLVIMDEGQRLKNDQAQLFIQLNRLACERRLILTGTPIHNHLREFFALIQFVQPNLFTGGYNEYKQSYETPILRACSDQTVATSEESERLRRLTGRFILRRLQNINREFLTEKQELVIFCRPSYEQIVAYEKVLDEYNMNEDGRRNPLLYINILRKICNHPKLLSDPQADLCSGDNLMAQSGKLAVVNKLLTNVLETDNKIVLSSYSTKILDQLQNLCNRRNIKWCRLDGNSLSKDRQKTVDHFNAVDSTTRVFLLSAKAGGQGLNLIGANRFVLFDSDWNPSSDQQAMARIWRDGQMKRVFIYRLLTCGTIEEKIFQRQITKASFEGAVLGKADHAPSLNECHFLDEELKDIFSAPDDYDSCNTHQLMKCDCLHAGQSNAVHGSAFDDHSEADDDELSVYERELKRARGPVDRKWVKMGELFEWEHYAAPVSIDILQDLCLTASDEIVFLFRNVVASDDL